MSVRFTWERARAELQPEQSADEFCSWIGAFGGHARYQPCDEPVRGDFLRALGARPGTCHARIAVAEPTGEAYVYPGGSVEFDGGSRFHVVNEDLEPTSALDRRVAALEAMAHTHEVSRPIPNVKSGRFSQVPTSTEAMRRMNEIAQRPVDDGWTAQMRGEVLDILRGLANRGMSWTDRSIGAGTMEARLEDWRLRAHNVLGMIDT